MFNFLKRKKTAFSLELWKDSLGITDLEQQTEKLKQKVKQLECTHDFKFVDTINSDYTLWKHILLECKSCKKTKRIYWNDLTLKEQRAYKTLCLIPDEWEVKKKGR